ncbi:MAG: radical SAM protein [Candidatus Bipolaricaulota bacterium]
MIIRETRARSILSRSKVYEYTINPYVGCQHACTYCYARFMKRFSGHKEPWGQFVDVKINAPDLLREEVERKPPGRVWISGVCDPYQPIERKYELAKMCVEILIQHDWPITIQTRSALVLRDLELLKGSSTVEVGMTVTTGDEKIRRLFEPYAPPIKERISALGELHSAGIRTFAMIAPMLPKAEELVDILDGKVDYALIDRMNYHHADWVYREYQLERPSLSLKSQELCSGLEKCGISCRVLF